MEKDAEILRTPWELRKTKQSSAFVLIAKQIQLFSTQWAGTGCWLWEWPPRNAVAPAGVHFISEALRWSSSGGFPQISLLDETGSFVPLLPLCLLVLKVLLYIVYFQVQLQHWKTTTTWSGMCNMHNRVSLVSNELKSSIKEYKLANVSFAKLLSQLLCIYMLSVCIIVIKFTLSLA